MESFTKFTQSVSTNWTPFADKVSKGFTQYKQLATEKLATNAEVTSLPNDYVNLEQRYEAVRHSAITLVKLAKTYTAAPTHYDVQTLQNQLANLTVKMGAKNDAESVAAAAAKKEEQTPNTHQHAMARTALEVSEKVGLEEPLGAALFKFGSIEEKVGDGKLEQDKRIQDKFVAPMMATIESSIALAQNARKEVQAARLTLDAAKSTFKNAAPSKADAARRDVESAEDRFVTIVEEAMNLMRAVVESPEPLRYLSELVSAQLEFHKAAASLLSDLAPEIDEIQVTQEALYRHENK
ncbi:BAR domain-containing protein [Linderina macrospora]|uniref:BAR domain-containing protein n=1 Tax=Linderina macrospora TaxID=4868 RepID=A0ACC1J261_9FUNG|nr:BAR domain-containing protein [Linderina macrospora]